MAEQTRGVVNLTTITDKSSLNAINQNFRKLQSELSSLNYHLEPLAREGKEAKDFLDNSLQGDFPVSRGGMYEYAEKSIAKGPTPPDNPEEGDLWVDTSVTPNLLKRWNGEEWQNLGPATPADIGAVAQEEYQQKVDEIMSDITEKADLEYVDGELVSKANKADTYTKTEVDNALDSKVSTTTYTTDMDGVVSRLDANESSIKQNADSIALKVSQTDYDADINDPDTGLKVRISNAETSITENADAITLKADQTTVDSLSESVSENTSQLSVQADEIAAKVSQSDFDSLEERVSTAESSITQNADEIASKVSKTTYDADMKNISSRFDSAESSITQNANAIKSKVSQSTYDTDISNINERIGANDDQLSNLTGRITTAESNITQNANQIKSKVSQSTYDVDIPNLKTRMTSAESSITQNANSIKTKVEKNGVISAINQTAESIKIQASKIQLQGAVSVLSDITGDLGTITAGDIHGVNIFGAVLAASGNSYKQAEMKSDYLTIYLPTQPDPTEKDYIEIHSDEISANKVEYDHGSQAYNSTSFELSGLGLNMSSNDSTYSIDLVNKEIDFSDAVLTTGKVITGNIYMYSNSLANDKAATYVGMGSVAESIGDGKAALRLGSTNTPSRTGLLYFGYDGTGPRIWGMDIYNRTYGSAPNMYITTHGTLGRSTSASKYKVDITEVETEGFADRILDLKLVKWFDRADMERHADYLTKLNKGEDTEGLFSDMGYIERHYGLKAEDVVEVGLPQFVSFGEEKDGKREIEGIEYDRLLTLLIPLEKEDRENIKDLTTRVEKLEQQMKGMTA